VIRIGTAGWSIPRQFAEEFGGGETGLHRYASRLAAVEINSTFRRPHKPETFARWAASVPEGFRFAVKLPKRITHELRLSGAEEPLQTFLTAIRPLGPRLGPLLVQLPPSLPFEADVGGAFLKLLRGEFAGDIVLEPRHSTWFTAAPDELLARNRVARAAADPARVPAAGIPGGWPDLAYFRLHGSPAMYRSAYEADYLDRLALTLASAAAAETWCIFDNTTLGAATGNALWLQRRLK
jgi:uncharacterized protein YecE (DUF72 family)